MAGILRSSFAVALTASVTVTAAATVTAQVGTSPLGLESIEGNGSTVLPWSASALRLQQIDETVRQLGPLSIQALSFRRDGNPFVQHSALPRRVNVSLTLGHGSLANATTNFAANLGPNATQVLAGVDVLLPNVAGRSPTVPGPWDAMLPFPNAWGYSGQQDLLWELLVHSNSGNNQTQVDAQDATLSSGIFKIKVPGCSGPFGELRTWSQLDNRGPQAQLRWLAGVYGGPANAPAGVLIGVGPSAIVLPKPPCNPFPTGLTRLYPDPLLEIPLGATGANGDASTTLAFAYNPLLLGLPLLLQGYAFDPGFYWRVQLGSGGDVTVPANPGGVRTRSFIAMSAVAQTATQVLDGGLVVGIH